MRRSMRRWMVLGLYWEKSWPVWDRSRMKTFFRAFSSLGEGMLVDRVKGWPKAWAA